MAGLLCVCDGVRFALEPPLTDLRVRGSTVGVGVGLGGGWGHEEQGVGVGWGVGARGAGGWIVRWGRCAAVYETTQREVGAVSEEALGVRLRDERPRVRHRRLVTRGEDRHVKLLRGASGGEEGERCDKFGKRRDCDTWGGNQEEHGRFSVGL